MKILIVDYELMGLDFAQRAIADGHQVRLAQKTPHPIGKGFEGVKVVDDWRASLDWVGRDGLILPTGNAKFIQELDRLREDFGFKVFGPSVQSAQLEINRSKGMEAMQAAGIELPHYECFNSLKEAQAFARKSDQAYVFKPMGSEDDKSLTYVACSPADMVGWLQRQIDRGMTLKAPCMLQEKIDMVCEVGVSGWMGPEGFLPEKFQLCWEHKKLMDHEIGPATGEMGTLCLYTEKDRIVSECLLPMEPIVRTLGHRGDFAIGCGLDSKGRLWPFEFTARCGWPAFFIQTASHKGDVAQWMMDLLNGEDSLKVDYRPTIGVVMAQPPFPQWNGKADCVEGNPIEGIEDVWDQAHPCMMMIGKGPYMDGDTVKDGPVYQTAGEQVCVVTGTGSAIEKARKACYSAVEQIRFPDLMYRTDIGQKLEGQMSDLHKAGIAKGMDYA